MPTASLTLFPAPAAWASRGRHAALPWSDVLARAEKPELWPGGGAIDAAEARLPAWTFAAFRDDARVVARDSATAEAQTRARVLEVNGLFLEYEDEPGADADAIARWWAGRLFLAYTTAFHDRPLGDRPEGPRWRVAVPFARGVGLAAAVEVARWARHPRRRAGTLADATEEPWRAPALPAIAPGGFRWCHGDGEPLDPDACVRELAAWRVADRREAATRELAGRSVRDAIAALSRRVASPALRPAFAWTGSPAPAGPLPEAALAPAAPAACPLTEGLWPGRLAVLVGPGRRGRTSFALQVAEANARLGHPVGLLLTRMGVDEAAARLVALRTAGASAAALLQGATPRAETEAALAALASAAPGLHVWAPSAAQRTPEEVVRFTRALSEVAGGRPPLLVLDALDAWEGDADALAGALGDLVHAGSLAPDWPGAAVLAVLLARDPALAGTRELAAGAGALDVDAHPVAREASLVLALTADPGPSPWPARLAVVRNRHGPTGAVSLAFEPGVGRFAAS